MTTNPATGTQKAQPVRNVQAIIAGAMVVIAALGGVNWAENPSWQAVLVTLLPALGAAYAAYQAKALPEQVVPYEDTAVYVDQDGQRVAGPASPLPDGTPVPEPDVIPDLTLDIPQSSDTKADAARYDPKHDTPEGN